MYRRSSRSGGQPRSDGTPGFDWYGALNDIGRRHLPRRIEAAFDVLMSDARRHNRYRPARWHRIAPRVAFADLPGDHLGCISRESAAFVAHLRDRLAARVRG